MMAENVGGNESDGTEHIEAEVAAELTAPLARSLRESRASVTYRWLDRIKERVEIDAGDVFPSEELLDHVPLLVDAIAEFMEDPAEEGTAADAVIAKAAELGEMRFDQGFSTHQVLVEFEILGGVILSHLKERVTRLGFTPPPDHVVTVVHRVFRALAKVQQATAARHNSLLEQRRHDVDQRLRLIRDMIDSLESRLPETLGAGGEDTPDRSSLVERLDDLRDLAGTGLGSRRRGVPLRGAVRESIRRVRSIAADAGVEVRMAEPLPSVDVPDAEVEHCLVVYLTNALRHCREVDGKREVEVSGSVESDDGVVVRVRNTGSTVEPTDDITRLAGAAGAAPDADPAGAPGVGLRLARDVISAVGGRTWASPASDPEGAIFALALPARRWDDEEPD